MIIWLASYPKSGNTWVRLFIDTLLNQKNNKIDINNIRIRQFPLRSDFKELSIDMDNVQDFVCNCTLVQEKLNLDNSVKFFKTHNAFWKSGNYAFTNYQNTKGVIHIVRDPRNIITSVKNHFNKQNYDEALSFMKNEKQSLGLKTRKAIADLPTVVSSWSNHYNSWKKMNKNYLLIKYENLLDDKNYEFSKIINYLKENLNISFDEETVAKAIESCNFEKLKDQEEKDGFKEAAEDLNGGVKKFFFMGPKNNWKNLLDKNTVQNIENAFRNEMIDLGYL